MQRDQYSSVTVCAVLVTWNREVTPSSGDSSGVTASYADNSVV